MSEPLAASHFGRRVTGRVLGIVTLGSIPAVFSFLQMGVPTWLSVAVFVAAGLAADFVARHQLSLFRCPRCGVSIRDHEPTKDEPAAAIRYFCPACDVMWDAGLRTPSGL